MRPISVPPAVRAEIDEAVTWCRQHHVSGADQALLDELTTAALQIATHPMAWPVSKLDPSVRVAFAHTSRRSGYWLERGR